MHVKDVISATEGTHDGEFLYPHPQGRQGANTGATCRGSSRARRGPATPGPEDGRACFAEVGARRSVTAAGSPHQSGGRPLGSGTYLLRPRGPIPGIPWIQPVARAEAASAMAGKTPTSRRRRRSTPDDSPAAWAPDMALPLSGVRSTRSAAASTQSHRLHAWRGSAPRRGVRVGHALEDATVPPRALGRCWPCSSRWRDPRGAAGHAGKPTSCNVTSRQSGRLARRGGLRSARPAVGPIAAVTAFSRTGDRPPVRGGPRCHARLPERLEEASGVQGRRSA